MTLCNTSVKIYRSIVKMKKYLLFLFFVVSHLWALAKTGKQIGGYFENGESFRGGLVKVNDNEFINTQGKVTTQQEQAESPASNNIWGALANFGNMILQTYAAVNGYSASSQGGSMGYSFTDTDSSVSSGSSSGQGMSTSTYQSIYSRWERQAKSNYESLTLLGGKYTSRNGDKSGVTGGN